MSEPTSKFFSEFPDGTVPINFVPSAGLGDSPEQWASELYDRLNLAHEWPIRSLDMLRSDYLVAATEGGDTSTPVLAMMRAGLTLRQIARYVNASPAALLAHDLFHFKSWGRTEQLLLADELLVEGMSLKGIARVTGLNRVTVRLLWSMRSDGDGSHVAVTEQGVTSAA